MGIILTCHPHPRGPPVPHMCYYVAFLFYPLEGGTENYDITRWRQTLLLAFIIHIHREHVPEEDTPSLTGYWSDEVNPRHLLS